MSNMINFMKWLCLTVSLTAMASTLVSGVSAYARSQPVFVFLEAVLFLVNAAIFGYWLNKIAKGE